MDFKLFLGSFLCLLSTTMASSDTSLIVNGNERFGKDLYRIISKEEGNLIASPFSAHIVLTMAYTGAGGTTAEALGKTLSLTDADTAADSYQTLMTSVKKIEHVTLKLANKIFVKKSFELKPAFTKSMDKFYAEAEPIDFVPGDAAANKINTWVEDNTNKKIKDLIKADSLDDSTRLVLVNAVYFKGDWAKKFDPKSTREETFYLTDGSEVKCNMMHITGKYKYMEDTTLNAKVLEMPYEGGDMSMLIFLPNERNGIKDLEANIHKFDFHNYEKNMGKWEVNVALPKFKIESEIPLTKILKQMGLEVMFSDSANFEKISANGEPLKVSEVIQKAFIEVNEEGAEAAAATGTLFTGLSGSFNPKKIVFEADHPFTFALVHHQEPNNVLFRGRVSNPV